MLTAEIEDATGESAQVGIWVGGSNIDVAAATEAVALLYGLPRTATLKRIIEENGGYARTQPFADGARGIEICIPGSGTAERVWTDRGKALLARLAAIGVRGNVTVQTETAGLYYALACGGVVETRYARPPSWHASRTPIWPEDEAPRSVLARHGFIPVPKDGGVSYFQSCEWNSVSLRSLASDDGELASVGDPCAVEYGATGLVSWHEDLESASDAAANYLFSGKPPPEASSDPETSAPESVRALLGGAGPRP